jgi:hypothetical protein
MPLFGHAFEKVNFLKCISGSFKSHVFTMIDGRKFNRKLLRNWTLDIDMMLLETGCPYLGMRSKK